MLSRIQYSRPIPIHEPYKKITEVNLSAYVYRLFHEDFSPIIGTNVQYSLTMCSHFFFNQVPRDVAMGTVKTLVEYLVAETSNDVGKVNSEFLHLTNM